jgi:spore maturation protein CgeB
VLFDASIFEQPFSQALALKIDARNKKLIHDLFLHLISEMVVASCAEQKPDLVLAMAQAPLSNKALERLRQHNVTTAFWFVEDYQIMGYWRNHAHLYDFYFTIQDDGFFGLLEKMGVKHFYYLPLAADPAVHRPLDMSPSEKACFGSDISFMGAGYYNRERMLQGLLDYDIKVWGNDWNPLSAIWPHVQREGQRLTTEETVKVFNASKISVNLHSSVCHEGVNPFGDFINPRTFEIAACGGFQLVDQRSMLSRHFEIGNEVVCYQSLEELREKISYYLMHPDERKRIALHGRQRVIREHTYEHRMRELIGIIGSRRPEIFNKARTGTSSVIDSEKFCIEHPEVKELIDDVNGHGLSPDLNHIVSTILKKNGPLAYHEALFLLMKEFQQKFQESGA